MIVSSRDTGRRDRQTDGLTRLCQGTIVNLVYGQEVIMGDKFTQILCMYSIGLAHNSALVSIDLVALRQAPVWTV